MALRFDSPGQCPGRRPVIAWGERQRANPSGKLAACATPGPLVVALIAAALMGCGAARPRATPVAGSLVFSCEPADARVSIDDTELGPCALWAGRAVALGPGTHRVVVSREGYLPLESELVPTGRRVTVRAALRRVPE